MSFSYNNVNAGTPSGAIMATFLTQDPSGWVIADGVARTTSNIYENLVNLSIGSRNVNQIYTPPNFKGAFLRGTGTVTYGSVSYTGQSKMQSQNHSIEKHIHTATQAAHNHTTNAETTHGNTAGKLGLGMCNGSNTESSNNNTNEAGQLNSFHVFDFNLNNSAPTITVDPIGDTDTAPFCYGVNWAIKL